MKLFLASTIKNKKTVEELKKFIPDFENKKVVYIPTASNSEEYFGSWKRDGVTTYNVARSLNSNLEVVELEFVLTETAQERIRNADVLFMAGGYPGYLSYWLHQRNLVDLIKQRLNEGMIYVGISAGAMVCGPSFKLIKFLGNEPLADYIPGMGIVDYEIWPHYKNGDDKKLKEELPELKVKFLHDGEQITIDN